MSIDKNWPVCYNGEFDAPGSWARRQKSIVKMHKNANRARPAKACPTHKDKEEKGERKTDYQWWGWRDSNPRYPH